MSHIKIVVNKVLSFQAGQSEVEVTEVCFNQSGLANATFQVKNYTVL